MPACVTHGERDEAQILSANKPLKTFMPPRKSKKSYDDSFRVNLGSPTFVYTVDEVQQMAIQMFAELKADGITHLKAAVVYQRPVDPQGQPITRVKGLPLKDRHLSPYRSAADEHGA